MTTERRSSARTPVAVNVDIHVAAGTTIKGFARDISTSGVCVDIYGDKPPIVGLAAHLDFVIWTGEEDIERRVSARIVRSSSASVALVFADDPSRTDEVVNEIRYYQQFERRTRPRGRGETDNRS